jgi:hypothetical protein
VTDPLEAELPKAGKVVMIDPNRLRNPGQHQQPQPAHGLQKLMRRQHEGVASVFKKHGIDPPTSPPMATPSPPSTACSNAAAANAR